MDWAAVHDLLKGGETSYMAEYMILFISVIVFAIMLIFYLFKRNKSKPANNEDIE